MCIIGINIYDIPYQYQALIDNLAHSYQLQQKREKLCKNIFIRCIAFICDYGQHTQSKANKLYIYV